MLALAVRRILFLALLLPLGAHAEHYPSTADPCAEHHFTDCDPVCSPGHYCVLDQLSMRKTCMNEMEYFGVIGGGDASASGPLTCYAITPMRNGADDIGVGLLYY